MTKTPCSVDCGAQCAQAQPPTAKPLFEIGDPVLRHGGTSLDFIADRIWAPNLATWRYAIALTSIGNSNVNQWCDGGRVFWESEDELMPPTGEKKLLGELWRELRTARALEQKMKECLDRAEKLRFAVKMLQDGSAEAGDK